jgi:DNA-binding beta-propeller fold protein YncE
VAAHLGCGGYCEEAGSPQGNGPRASNIRIDTAGTVIPLSDGTVPITLTCRVNHACSGGALLLAGPFNYAVHSQSMGCGPGEHCMGRSNLVVPARSTRTIAVPLSPAGRQLLDSYRRVGVAVMVEFPPAAFEQSTWPVTLALSRNAPSGAVVLGANPRAVAVSGSTVWVACPNQLLGVDATTGRLVGRPVPIGASPDSIAAVAGTIWVASHTTAGTGTKTTTTSTLTRVNAATGATIGQPINLGNNTAVGMAAGQGSVWIALARGFVVRVDPSTLREVGRPIGVGQAVPSALVDGDGSVWVAAGGGVVRIDPSSNAVVGRPASIGNGVYSLAVGQGGVWVANDIDAVGRIDPATGHVIGTPVKVGLGPDALALDHGGVWVANSWSDTVTRLDATSGGVVGSPIRAGLDPVAIGAAGGSLWVADGGNDLLTKVGETGAG